MYATVVVLFTVIVLWLVGVGAAVGGTISSIEFAPEVWVRAAYRRRSWIWQAALVVFVPGALVYSGIYFLRVRPKLGAAEREIAELDPGYDAWIGRRRWYHRFSRARRSPYEWQKAARRWWQWIPTAVIGEALAAVYLSRAGAPHQFGFSETMAYAAGAAWAVAGFLAAIRLGFWYGEHMRLTGRSPGGGGSLLP